jgi:hypothetical protein
MATARRGLTLAVEGTSLAEVTSMRTGARDRSLEAATHRSGRKYRPGGRLRILPDRVHLRRGFRLRGHIPR